MRHANTLAGAQAGEEVQVHRLLALGLDELQERRHVGVVQLLQQLQVVGQHRREASLCAQVQADLGDENVHEAEGVGFVRRVVLRVSADKGGCESCTTVGATSCHRHAHVHTLP